MHTWNHTTVLLEEAVQALLSNDTPSESPRLFVDATFGRGGHARLLLSRLDLQDRLLAFDRDPAAIAVAQAMTDARLSIRHDAFSAMSDLPEHSLDGLLMDLGVSSPQIDDAARGFSFRFDAPLDMRMDTTRGKTVAQWLAGVTLDDLTEVIRDYGEERFAFPIAKAIDARRQSGQPVCTTSDLAELVARTVKTRESGQNPATRTFQAFRIFINAELEELQQALAASLRLLKPQGRLVVISFHSLEDRIVKQFIAEHSRDAVDRRALFAPPKPMRLKALNRVKPSAAEVAENPRSRSAIMRVASRTHVGVGGLP